MKWNIKALVRGRKGGWLMVGAAALGMILIYLSTRTPAATPSQDVDDTARYQAELESKLAQVVARLTGEDDPAVFVTLEGSEEIVYADMVDQSDDRSEDNAGADSRKTQLKSDRKQNYILVEDADGGQRALVVTTRAPTVRGVVVVTSGAADPDLREQIVTAVTTALNLSSKKVCVVGVKYETE